MNRWEGWYGQGKRDLERARLTIGHRFYEWACFTSQQSAEKSVLWQEVVNGCLLLVASRRDEAVDGT